MDIREIIAIRDRLKTDLSVVEKFLAIAQRDATAMSPPVERRSEQGSAQSVLKPIFQETIADYGGIGKSIIEAITLSPNEFTIADVDSALKKHFSRSLERGQIATVLSRLTRQNKIEVVKPKHGRTGAVYRHL